MKAVEWEGFEARFCQGERTARTRVSFTEDLKGVGSWAQVMLPLIASGNLKASYYSRPVGCYYSLMKYEQFISSPFWCITFAFSSAT